MNWIDTVLTYFNQTNSMAIMLLGLIMGVFYILVRLHLNKDSAFDLEDLVTTDGKLDEKKFTRFGAWVLSSWGFIYIMIKHPDSLPEWYFLGYMGVWVTNAILDHRMNGSNSNRYGSDPNKYRSHRPGNFDSDRPDYEDRPPR
jgi:hypothetical protein